MQKYVLAVGACAPMHAFRACLCVSRSPAHQSLSVQAVLGGGGVCGGRVVRQGAPASRS